MRLFLRLIWRRLRLVKWSEWCNYERLDYEALEKAITPKTKAVIPIDYYIHVIMQEKIKLYLEYVKNASFWYDIKLIFKTFEVIVKE